MRKSFFVIIFAVVLWIAQYCLYNFVSPFITPNLLLLFLIFVDLSLGIRYGILAGFISGILTDSFSPVVFGINMFSYVLLAYVIVYLYKNISPLGSQGSRRLLALIVTIIFLTVKYILYLMFYTMPLFDVLVYVMLPEILATVIVAKWAFRMFKLCALKLFV